MHTSKIKTKVGRWKSSPREDFAIDHEHCAILQLEQLHDGSDLKGKKRD